MLVLDIHLFISGCLFIGRRIQARMTRSMKNFLKLGMFTRFRVRMAKNPAVWHVTLRTSCIQATYLVRDNFRQF